MIDMDHLIQRRRFIQVSAAAAGASYMAMAKAMAADVPGPQREYAWLPMGLQTWSLRRFEIGRVLKEIQKLNLHHLEFASKHAPEMASPEAIWDMLKQLRRLDIAAVGRGVTGFTADHEKNRTFFEFANRMGIRNISANPTPDSFDSLDKLVADYGIRIAIHNHGPKSRYSKISDVTKAIKGRHPWIGACADLGHYIRSGEDPVKAIYEFNGRLFGMHVKDFARTDDNKYHEVVIGRGRLDLVAMFKALRETDFPADGCMALEYEENPDNPIPDIKACLAAASEAAAKII